MTVRQQRICAEVALLQSAGFQLDWDIQDGGWVRILNFTLPANLGPRCAQVLILIPRDYPNTPPNGIYIDQAIKLSHHYFQFKGIHNPLGDQGWAWYCFHINGGSGGWRPSTRIVGGDNLFQFLKLTQALMRPV